MHEQHTHKKKQTYTNRHESVCVCVFFRDFLIILNSHRTNVLCFLPGDSCYKLQESEKITV